MPSSTLTLKKDSTNTVAFGIVTSSEYGAKYLVSGRAASQPFGLEITRQLSAPSSTMNDKMLIRMYRTDRNTDTGRLATGQVQVSISIPKDNQNITTTEIVEMLVMVGSLFNDGAAGAATAVNATALVETRLP